jgi:hypothetical protein
MSCQDVVTNEISIAINQAGDCHRRDDREKGNSILLGPPGQAFRTWDIRGGAVSRVIVLKTRSGALEKLFILDPLAAS